MEDIKGCCKWHKGRFVGIAWENGDPFTYLIWTVLDEDFIKITNLLLVKDTAALDKKCPYVQGQHNSQPSKCRCKATISQPEELLHGTSSESNDATSTRLESWLGYWLSRRGSEPASRKLLGLQNHLVVVRMGCPMPYILQKR
eukprot:13673074-Ditylum_brightwellii.AAC.1